MGKDYRIPVVPFRENLFRRGVQITHADADRIPCLNAACAAWGHERGDYSPTMIVYDRHLYCPACGTTLSDLDALIVLDRCNAEDRAYAQEES